MVCLPPVPKVVSRLPLAFSRTTAKSVPVALLIGDPGQHDLAVGLHRHAIASSS